MKVLILNWKDPKHPRAGGAEVFTFEVARRLVQLGDDVTWFCSSFAGGSATSVQEGIKIVRSGSLYTVFGAARRYVNKLSSKEMPDIVVDEVNTRPFNPTAYLPRRTPVCNLVHQLAREVWFQETPFPISVLGRYLLEDWWLRGVSHLPTLAMSESTKADLLELGFDHVELTRTGLSSDSFAYPLRKQEPPLLLSISRLTKGKRVRDAIEAYRLVRREIPCDLVVIGSGPLEAKLRRAYPEVQFVGRVPDSTRDNLLERASIILVPGTREGWGRVALEAQARGTVPVVYNIPGLRDAVDFGKQGRMALRNSPRALASACLELLRDKGELERQSRTCFEWSKGFNWDNTATTFREFLVGVSRER